MIVIFNIFLIIFLFGFSIFIHELGHFLAARWRGLAVDAFSIGFGKALWKKKVSDVEYRLGMLPFGGYVALPQMVPIGGDKLEGTRFDGSLPEISPVDKIIVAVAGPVMNILFAFFLGFFVWGFGQATVPSRIDALITGVTEGSESAKQGLAEGDFIVGVQGGGRKSPAPIRNSEDFFIECMKHDEVTIFTTNKSGEAKTATVEPIKTSTFGPKAVIDLQFRNLCRVGDFNPATGPNPAREAGLQRHDIIESINGTPVFSISQLGKVVRANENKPCTLGVYRKSPGKEAEQLTLTVIPKALPTDGFRLTESGDYEQYVTNIVRLGYVTSSVQEDYRLPPQRPTPWAQVADGFHRVFDVLGSLVRPKEAKNIVGSLRGPIGILDIYWQIKNSTMYIIVITVLINVNLAIMNLLPFPILDGGHIFFASWQLIFRRRVNDTVTTMAYYACLIFILSAFLFLTFRDGGRIFERTMDNRKIEKAIKEGESATPEPPAGVVPVAP